MIFSVAGISRSVTIAAAYIMSVTTINHQEAFQILRSARNAANPNIGFQRQLYEFEISGASDKVSFSGFDEFKISGASDKVSFSGFVRATKGMLVKAKLKIFRVNCLISLVI